jgi:hypothetical protein
VFDLTDGSLVFRTTLPEPPRRIERLQVTAWRDRYLVFAGAGDDDPDAEVAPLEQYLHAGGAGAPLSGAVWAVDAAHGRPLWPVPALIERHCLHPAQPAGLPILTFCRLLQRREGGNPVLSVLCLDKRTGHAVFASDRFAPESPQAFGCQLVGDSRAATIAIGIPAETWSEKYIENVAKAMLCAFPMNPPPMTAKLRDFITVFLSWVDYLRFFATWASKASARSKMIALMTS